VEVLPLIAEQQQIELSVSMLMELLILLLTSEIDLIVLSLLWQYKVMAKSSSVEVLPPTVEQQ
jgi:hypothetical protein